MSVQNTKCKQIIYLTGATAVGKTLLSLNIAEKLKILIIRTDDIREILRSTVSQSDYPELFIPSFKLSEKTNNNSIIKSFEKQCNPITDIIIHLIESTNSNYPCMFEGIHLLPSLLTMLVERDTKMILMKQPKLDEHLIRINNRNLLKGVHNNTIFETYLRNIRDIGNFIEKAWMTNNKIKDRLLVVKNTKKGMNNIFKFLR